MSVLKFTDKGSKLGCPNCNFRTIKMYVKLRKEFARIQCGACRLRDSYSITSLDEKVDVYGKFVDTIRADMKVIEEFGPEEALKDPLREERYTNVIGIGKPAPSEPVVEEKEEALDDLFAEPELPDDEEDEEGKTGDGWDD